MRDLYDKKISYLVGIISSIVLFGLAFWYLTQGYPLGEFMLPIAGLMVIWVTFGYDSIFKFFSSPGKGIVKVSLLGYITSLIFSVIAREVGHYLGISSTSNPVNDTFTSNNFFDIAKEFLLSGTQIIGEELIIIVPFIILMNLMIKVGVKEKNSIILLVILTSILFGALHLSTYDWNFYQCFVVVGLTRIPFTIASIKQDSIWAGIISHIIFDWSLFVVVVITSIFHLA